MLMKAYIVKNFEFDKTTLQHMSDVEIVEEEIAFSVPPKFANTLRDINGESIDGYAFMTRAAAIKAILTACTPLFSHHEQLTEGIAHVRALDG